MIKHSNIAFFIFISVSLHAFVLTQYTLQAPVKIGHLEQTFSIELSRYVAPQQQATQPVSAKPVAAAKTIRSTNKNAETLMQRPDPVEQSQAKTDVKPLQENRDSADSSQPAQPARQPASDNDIKNQYLSAVLKRIEQNKFYPSAARRRGMQETILVSFYLLADGKIDQLEINGQHKPLRTAAQSAVVSALPFEQPPADITTPLKIQYAMAFKLN